MPADAPASPRPYGLKPIVARMGPVYLWARRMRAFTRYLARRPHDADFSAFGVLPGDGLFLDVGASIGQSALSFRIFNREAPILSLEPLPSHQGDLRFVRRVIRGHRFMNVGAAEKSCRATLYVPMLGSYALPAESSLDRDAAISVLERLEAEGVGRTRLSLKEVVVDLRRLDELELDPSFVKIDVEGAELGVLRGLHDTLKKCRPVLLIERSERFDQVVDLLSADDYRPFAYDPETRRFDEYRDQQTVNVFFLPPGREPAPIAS